LICLTVALNLIERLLIAEKVRIISPLAYKVVLSGVNPNDSATSPN